MNSVITATCWVNKRIDTQGKKIPWWIPEKSWWISGWKSNFYIEKAKPNSRLKFPQNFKTKLVFLKKKLPSSYLSFSTQVKIPRLNKVRISEKWRQDFATYEKLKLHSMKCLIDLGIKWKILKQILKNKHWLSYDEIQKTEAI